MRNRRWVYSLATLLVLCLAWLLWFRTEPAWSASLTADQDAVTPWEVVQLTAHVEPASVLTRRSGWDWTWKSDGITFSHAPGSAPWKEGKAGDHEITLMLYSPWGTTRTVSTTVTVRFRDYYSPVGHSPDFSNLVRDPAPSGLPFGIKDVWVEKTHVCQGESSRIRVTPFDRRGEESWLSPIVNGQPAWETSFQTPLAHPGPRLIPIVVADPRVKSGQAQTYVYIEVEDCVAPFPMYVNHVVIPPKNDNIAFKINLFNGPA